MENIRDASFGSRLGAFAIDVMVTAGSQVVVGFLLAAILVPFSHRGGDPVDWLSPQSAEAAVLSWFLVPLAYLVLSWSRLFGHRSVGKRLFRLRVIRDDR